MKAKLIKQNITKLDKEETETILILDGIKFKLIGVKNGLRAGKHIGYLIEPIEMEIK